MASPSHSLLKLVGTFREMGMVTGDHEAVSNVHWSTSKGTLFPVENPHTSQCFLLIVNAKVRHSNPVPPSPRIAPKHCLQCSPHQDAALQRLIRNSLFVFMTLLYCIFNVGLAWNRHIYTEECTLVLSIIHQSPHLIPYHFFVVRASLTGHNLSQVPLSKGSWGYSGSPPRSRAPSPILM